MQRAKSNSPSGLGLGLGVGFGDQGAGTLGDRFRRPQLLTATPSLPRKPPTL